MKRLVPLLGLAAILLFAVGTTADDKPAPDDHHGGMFITCAKACNDCQRECDSCAGHCAGLVAEGKKDHMKTLGTCTDCAEICSAAARVTAHQGPMSAIICDACAKACDTCGDACAEFKDDDHMKKCSEQCKTCAKACREMVKHAAHLLEGK